MSYFLVAVLTVFALIIVLLPFITKSGSKAVNKAANNLPSKEQAVRSLIEEVQLDFEAGNLPEKQYNELMDQYVKDLNSLSEFRGKPRKSGGAVDKIEEEVLRLRQGKFTTCPKSRAKCKRDDHFCPRCGANISSEGRPS